MPEKFLNRVNSKRTRAMASSIRCPCRPRCSRNSSSALATQAGRLHCELRCCSIGASGAEWQAVEFRAHAAKNGAHQYEPLLRLTPSSPDSLPAPKVAIPLVSIYFRGHLSNGLTKVGLGARSNRAIAAQRSLATRSTAEVGHGSPTTATWLMHFGASLWCDSSTPMGSHTVNRKVERG